jgi:DNA-binding PadR family transcriptional regulator
MSLRHTLLGILDWVPLHGYALREAAKQFSWLHPMTNSNLYPALRELESEGFIAHEAQIRNGRLRKVYAITEAGRHELRRWLVEPTPAREVSRDPLLLKICLLREGALHGAVRYVDEHLARAAEAVDRTERYLKDHATVMPRFARMVTEHALDQIRLRHAFLQRVRDELPREAAAPPLRDRG